MENRRGGKHIFALTTFPLLVGAEASIAEKGINEGNRPLSLVLVYYQRLIVPIAGRQKVLDCEGMAAEDTKGGPEIEASNELAPRRGGRRHIADIIFSYPSLEHGPIG